MSSTSKPLYSVFPYVPTARVENHIAQKMTTNTKQTLREPTQPTAAMSSLSLQDESQTTPTPKQKKALSESSLSTMTPPDSTRGISAVIDESSRTAVEEAGGLTIKLQDEDDVFGRASSATPSESPKKHLAPAPAVTKVQANFATPVSFKQNPRPDRLNSPITPANAQGVLPPEACVFVANLATMRTDDQLELACHEHFDVFGECHVKVRRDKHRHPFALVQYYSIEDANVAIRSSHDMVIDGRKIRTEHAQARRSLVLTRTGGGIITSDEAEAVLGEYGPIAQTRPTTHGDANEFGLPEGIWVQFAYYLDYKDALKSFNGTNSDYKVQIPPDLEPRSNIRADGSPFAKGFRTPRSSTDQKSIFVGNLPQDTTEEHLKGIFWNCGAIKAINIIHKPIMGGTGYNTFGFVEFSSVGEAETAANLEIEMNGYKIRVEPKEYSARRHTRLRAYSPAMSPFGGRGGMPNFHSMYGHGVPLFFNPGFYGMNGQAINHTGNQFNHGVNINDLSPFHPHHAGGFSHIYATPPSSSRISRRNDMLYTGSPSPQNMPLWNSYGGNNASGYGGGITQIPEEFEGQRY